MFAGIFSYISYMEYKGVSDEHTLSKNRKKERNISEIYQPLVFCTDYDDFCDYLSTHALQSRMAGDLSLS